MLCFSESFLINVTRLCAFCNHHIRVPISNILQQPSRMPKLNGKISGYKGIPKLGVIADLLPPHCAGLMRIMRCCFVMIKYSCIALLLKVTHSRDNFFHSYIKIADWGLDGGKGCPSISVWLHKFQYPRGYTWKFHFGTTLYSVGQLLANLPHAVP